MTDGRAVNPYSLVEVNKVWRGVKPHPVTALLQYGGKHVRGTSLAVGACHVYGLILSVWMIEMLIQRLGITQSLLISTSAHLFKGRRYVIQIF